MRTTPKSIDPRDPLLRQARIGLRAHHKVLEIVSRPLQRQFSTRQALHSTAGNEHWSLWHRKQNGLVPHLLLDGLAKITHFETELICKNSIIERLTWGTAHAE